MKQANIKPLQPSYRVDRQEWAALSILEQLGNIGSEVGRTIAAQQSGNQDRFEGALRRALDLFEATIDVLIGQQSGRIREVLIAREQFLNLFFGSAPSGDAAKIEKYFMYYAVAARSQHES